MFAGRIKEELHSSSPEELDKLWRWEDLQNRMENGPNEAIDRALMARFLKIMPHVDQEQFGFLQAVDDALLLTHPAELHPAARQVQRKIILHVGPTNSGKTYHALRALAGAQYGCYAGPLRLLATEIFGRLNNGDIAPTGADPTKKYPRVCNLITGEDVKILDDEAGLISATVEMVPLTRKFDVVVIDEIQMIANSERGGAWTQALLGLNAEEIHLCGEESAVELIKELVKPAGDEVIVNRYERLTPLQIAPKSLGNNLADIRPGDCIVAFSRKSIFGLKHLIESKTGLRCAVIYGKLPPEVRVDQAAKFNAGDVDHSVLIASDAIGMGLNLKIKRVLFSTLKKWDGYKNVTISLSEIKQIAGRAGRYGLHDADSVGIATTFLHQEHQILASAMSNDVRELKYATIAADSVWLGRLHRTLPPSTGLGELFQLLQDVAICDAPFSITDYSKLLDAAYTIDEACPNLSIATKATIAQVPVPWAIPEAVPIFESMLVAYENGEIVDPEAIFRQAGLMLILEDVMAAREEQQSQKDTDGGASPVLSMRESSIRLEGLELLHKMLCVYLWMSYRFPVTFCMRERVQDIKLATEAGIQFCLEMVSLERAKDIDERLTKDSPPTSESPYA